MTSILSALSQAKKAFHTSDTAALDAQVLLCEVLGVNRAYLLAHGEQDLSEEAMTRFQSMIQRRSEGEPIAYILGTRGFYDLEFIVTPAVLIPRPETELLLEKALELTQSKPDLTVADIGTGSGALAVTFARHRPGAQVYATDISASALNIARQNANRNQTKVEFLQGNLATALIERQIKVDLLMANLPYIPKDDMTGLAVSLYEPHLALDGGNDGLDLIRELMGQLDFVRAAGCEVLLEIGAEQALAVEKIVRQNPAVCVFQIIQDYAGLDRIVYFRLS